jgi:hypothetical protein
MFTAQLFVSLWDEVDEITTREPIKGNGDEIVMLNAVRDGRPHTGVVFDKEKGGEPLRAFPIENCGMRGAACIWTGRPVILHICNGLRGQVEKK